MISILQHKRISDLLDNWERLNKLYSDIQVPGQLVVTVLGNRREEFRGAALREAKKTLREQAEVIKNDLSRLGFDIRDLSALRDSTDE